MDGFINVLLKLENDECIVGAFFAMFLSRGRWGIIYMSNFQELRNSWLIMASELYIF